MRNRDLYTHMVINYLVPRFPTCSNFYLLSVYWSDDDAIKNRSWAEANSVLSTVDAETIVGLKPLLVFTNWLKWSAGMYVCETLLTYWGGNDSHAVDDEEGSEEEGGIAWSKFAGICCWCCSCCCCWSCCRMSWVTLFGVATGDTCEL